MPKIELKSCANCGNNIGALETPPVFKGQTVCEECYDRLTKKSTASSIQDAIPASEFESPPEPVVTQSTWDPAKAALFEKAQRENARAKRGIWGIVLPLSLTLSAIGIALLSIGSTFAFITLIPGLILLWLCVAFLPIMVAESRKHPNLSGVRALTLLGFFIPILWLVAIVWAYMAPDPKE